MTRETLLSDRHVNEVLRSDAALTMALLGMRRTDSILATTFGKNWPSGKWPEATNRFSENAV
jgi:hypothetical protein